MALDVRPYSPELDADFRLVWQDVYERGRTMDPAKSIIDGDWEDPQILYQGGVAAAAFNRIKYVITRGEADVPCAGIAAVGVKPEFRHMGIGTQLMQWAMEYCRDQGDVYSLLYPFRGTFYRRLGYEGVGDRVEVHCPSHRLPAVPIGLPVRRLTPADAELLQPCYEAFIRRVAGSPHRSPELWKERFGENPPMIYAVGDPVEAYAWTTLGTGFWEEFSLGEFVWSSLRGYEAMLGVIRGLAINLSSVKWYEPSDGPFRTSFMDQGVELSSKRLVMGRILDVPGALGCLRPEASGAFSIEVTDNQLKSNSGCWQVTFEPGVVRVVKTDKAQIKLDIKTLSQAYIGEPSFAALLAQGKIHVYSDAEASAACRLFAAMPVCCLAFF